MQAQTTTPAAQRCPREGRAACPPWASPGAGVTQTDSKDATDRIVGERRKHVRNAGGLQGRLRSGLHLLAQPVDGGLGTAAAMRNAERGEADLDHAQRAEHQWCI